LECPSAEYPDEVDEERKGRRLLAATLARFVSSASPFPYILILYISINRTDKLLEKTNVTIDWDRYVDEDEEEEGFDMGGMGGGGMGG
jgi:hypothetical protein